MFQTIQACRALAALLVVFFHAGGTLTKDKYFGASASPIEEIFWFGGSAGVAFFFVLSGFIISYVHRADFDRPERVMSYLRKRATRIYPTYIILFLGVYLFAFLTPSLRNTVPSDPVIVLKSLLLLPQDKQLIGGTGAPVLVVAWSLQYEIVFYSIFAVAILNRWAFYALGAAFLLNFLLRFVSAPYEFPRSFFASHLIILFAIGMIASAVVRGRTQLSSAGSIVWCAALAFLAAAVIATLCRDNYSTLMFDMAYGAISALLILSLTRYEGNRSNRLQSKLPSLLGNSSYALYLIHFPLISALCKLTALVFPRSTAGAWAAFLVIVAACVFAALSLHTLVEEPLLRALSKRPVRAVLTT